MKKVLITGGNGYIARSLAKSLVDCEIEVITRRDLDLTDGEACRVFFYNKTYDAIIHTAIEGGSRLKQDDFTNTDNNLRMYLNLIKYAAVCDKFISFGSGAELYNSNTPYGLSKSVIRQSMLDKPNCFNIRVFAVFDEYELNTRFIKSNLFRYLHGEDMVIHQNKYMDFFHMSDLVKLVGYYIHNDNPPKEIDCCYSQAKSLCDIASFINELSSNKSKVIVENAGNGHSYTGNFLDLGLDYLGLENGIKAVYSKIKAGKYDVNDHIAYCLG